MKSREWPQEQPRVVSAKAVDNYQVELSFNDGTVGVVDMKGWVVGAGGVFEPLSDERIFRQVRVSRTGGTIEWPGGIDLCPDVLYSRATGIPIPFAEPREPARR